MKFTFGKNHHATTIEANSLKQAIKLFKVTELFPEQYVDDSYVKDADYDSELRRYHYTFKVEDPQIPIFSDDTQIASVGLKECINVDFSSILPHKNLLEAPQGDRKEENPLPVVHSATALANTPHKVVLREQHDALLKKQAELEAMLSTHHKAMNALKDELSQKMKVVYVLETYLGIHEEITLIKEGTEASEDEPLTLFQQKLYMDEEIGLWEDGGLDFKKIEAFDAWIAANYERFIYRPKGICVFQVRRHKKDYGDIWVNHSFSIENKKTYFLIRNGSKLYRIWSNVTTGDRLFPTSEEYQKIFKTESKWSTERARKAIQKRHEDYLYGLIAIQGIIERTDVLGLSLRGSVNLTRPDGAPEDRVHFIRDDEPKFWLRDGHPPWEEFIKENRKTIDIGTRIIVTGHDFKFSNSESDAWRTHPFRVWESPSNYEVFIVEEKVDLGRYHGETFKILFQPSQEWQKRKRRVPFLLYRDETINFDAITVEDCDYYAQNRLERRHYLHLLPILKFVRTSKLEEQKLESGFTRFIADRLGWDHKDYPKIQAAIDWWKLKNKWKRGLMKDDAKAVRMIMRRLQHVL